MDDVVSMNTKRESARIFQFPPGGRARKADQDPANAVATASSGPGWYHDVAIHDAKSDKDREPPN